MRLGTEIPKQYQFVSDEFEYATDKVKRQQERDKRHLQDALYEIMEQSTKVREWIMRARRELEVKRKRVRMIAKRYIRDE